MTEDVNILPEISKTLTPKKAGPSSPKILSFNNKENQI